MPTYYAAGVSVRLSTTSTRDSLTHNPLGSIGGRVKTEIESAEAVVSRGTVLKESSLAAEESSEGDLTFLGKEGEIPFYCVGVHVTGTQDEENLEDEGKAVRKKAHTIKLRSSGAAGRAGLSSHLDWTPDESGAVLHPRALTLSVQVDKNLSFRRTKDSTARVDLKIDVFFNGQFTHSTYVAGHSVQTRGKQKLYFSGKRIGRAVEGAWLVFPPSKNAGPSQNMQEERKSMRNSEERWNSIAAALRKEVNALGINKKGRRPPSGEYLESLAELNMPNAVENLQRLALPKFGVIDVVITLGQGKKYSTADGYLRQPERLTDRDFAPKKQRQVVLAPIRKGSVAFDDTYLKWAMPTPTSSSPNQESAWSSTITTSTPATPSFPPNSASASPSKASRDAIKLTIQGDLHKPSTIGFLNAALNASPKTVEDVANYGIGPPPPAKPMPRTPLSESASSPKCKLISGNSMDSVTGNNMFDPTGLSPSFKVMSILPGPSKRATDPPHLSPYSKVLADFSVAPSHTPALNQKGVNGLSIDSSNPENKPEYPTWKEINISGSPRRPPSCSPITPGPTPLVASTDIEQQNHHYHDLSSCLPICSPNAFIPAKQATASLSHLANRMSYEMNGQTFPSQADIAMKGNTYYANEVQQTSEPSSGAVRCELPTAGPVPHSQLQRLARQPLREANRGEIGPPRIPSSMLDTVYGTMAISQLLSPAPQPPAASSSEPDKRSSLVVRLKVPNLSNGERKAALANNEPSSLGDKINSQTSKRKSYGGPGTPGKRRKVSTRSQSLSNETMTPSSAQRPANSSSSISLSVKPRVHAKANLQTTQSSITRPKMPPPAAKSKIKIATSDTTVDATPKSKAASYQVPALTIPGLSRECVISYASRTDPSAADIATSLHPRLGSLSIAPLTKAGPETGRLQDRAPKRGRQASGKGVGSGAGVAAESDGGNGGAGGESGGGDGAYRQIRSERTGEFKEIEVLMGVRFVVGW